MAVDPIRGAGDPQVRVAGARTHELFEQHARMIYGLCRALLRDPDEADDATQATFISAYKSLLGGSRVREPAAWLATIARNECAGRARARMREPLPLLESDIAEAPGPEAELDRLQVVGELQQAISELPEKQREAVVLRDLYGLRYTEVGAALGMSVASVESLLFRARRSLRVSLKPVASGALAVPIAVREGIAQALPAFSAGAAGGATSGAAGLGLFAKLAGGPVAVKAAAGVAAAVAAGSIAVGVEHGVQGEPGRAPVSAPTQRHAPDLDTVAPGGGAPVTASIARPTGPATGGRGAGQGELSGREARTGDGAAETPGGGAGGRGGTGDEGADASGQRGHGVPAEARSGSPDVSDSRARSGPANSGGDRVEKSGDHGSASTQGSGEADPLDPVTQDSAEARSGPGGRSEETGSPGSGQSEPVEVESGPDGATAHPLEEGDRHDGRDGFGGAPPEPIPAPT